MDVKLFNYRSPRAVKARLGYRLSPWGLFLEVSVVILLLSGIGIVLLGSAMGWAIVGLAAIPAMIVEWYKYELRDTPVIKNGKTIDDLLDSELLGLLPDQPTPQDIAVALGQTNGGLFFAARFGVGGGFLQHLVSSDRNDTKKLFEDALRIAKQLDGRVSAGVLILAMMRQLPMQETLLGHLQLDDADLENGTQWYHRLRDLVERAKKRPHHPGGIGRDWSFGWIPQLSRFGQNISETSVQPSELRADIVAQMMKALQGGKGSVGLVGQVGVGKTEIIHELAHLLMNPTSKVPQKLRYHQIFMLDAGRLISSTKERETLEGMVQMLLGEAYAAKNIVVCLDNAHLFFEEGVGSVDISSVLLPILEAGRLPIILAVEEQRFLKISKHNPALASAITRINVEPTNRDDTLRILEDKVPFIEYKHKVMFMYQALKEAHRLSARYVYDIAMPGQAVALLEAAAEYAESGLVTAKSVNVAIEKTIGVKTHVVSDDSERDTLLHLEDLLHKRMIGQDRAVSVVSDALRRARAGIRNQQRPVGTFLFLGPTGVGKTELAKSLAEVYFGGEKNIIRLDMNEFVSAKDVSRLIADGTKHAGSLTAKVMKQPFSVVLLDEIEKAHSTVLTTLLQLLDEGILRDERGREVSFRDTIVIATSNAGADRIQEYLHRGYDLRQFEDKFVDELISGDVFHPEFLNRFDEIVLFEPLKKHELLQVVDLILDDINKNLANQKVSVTVEPAAKEYLVEAGYDPRLGARPMRRVVQRAVESTVAKLMLSKKLLPGGSVVLKLEHIQAVLDKQ